jgi:hypothetical protein
MTTAVQVQYRRGSSTQVAAFTGAAGEMVVDTTGNRVVIQDGTTAGGWPAAKLSEVQTNARTQVSDGNYTALATDRTIAYITLTASRIIALPAASAYPTGSRLLVVDETGNCSAANTITLSRVGSDLIDGATTAVIGTAYGYVALESNGANKWTIVDQVGSTINGLSGAVTIASNGGAVITAAGTAVTIGEPGGFRNGFYNPAMDVWQRGTSGTATTTAGPSTQIGPDGWYVVPTGASVAWAQASGRLITKNSVQVTGASSVTDLIVKQRIESVIAARYCSQTVTVQAQVYNGTGGSITPKLSVNRATGVDNGTYSNVDVSAVSLQSCAASAWTQVAYTFSANANSFDGLEIVFDFGNNFGANTKTVQVGEFDMRVTPGVSAGLNSNPPPPELRPVGTELATCLRYFWAIAASGAAEVPYLNANAFTATLARGVLQFPAVMRAAPTAIFSAANTFYFSGAGSNLVGSAITAEFATPINADIGLTVSGASAGNGGWIRDANVGSSSMQFSAEL